MSARKEIRASLSVAMDIAGVDPGAALERYARGIAKVLAQLTDDDLREVQAVRYRFDCPDRELFERRTHHLLIAEFRKRGMDDEAERETAAMREGMN